MKTSLAPLKTVAPAGTELVPLTPEEVNKEALFEHMSNVVAQFVPKQNWPCVYAAMLKYRAAAMNGETYVMSGDYEMMRVVAKDRKSGGRKK